jgi:GNAT superfamily N-acetyltransferase
MTKYIQIPDEAYQRILAAMDEMDAEEEASEGDWGNIQGFRDYLELEYGVSVWISEGPSGLTLSKLVVPEGMREQGVGTSVMEEICAYADSLGVAIGLSPDTTYGGAIGRLEDFYRGFGFVPNKGRNKDYGFMESWVRPAN